MRRCFEKEENIYILCVNKSYTSHGQYRKMLSIALKYFKSIVQNRIDVIHTILYKKIEK